MTTHCAQPIAGHAAVRVPYQGGFMLLEGGNMPTRRPRWRWAMAVLLRSAWAACRRARDVQASKKRYRLRNIPAVAPQM